MNYVPKGLSVSLSWTESSKLFISEKSIVDMTIVHKATRFGVAMQNHLQATKQQEKRHSRSKHVALWAITYAKLNLELYNSWILWSCHNEQCFCVHFESFLYSLHLDVLIFNVCSNDGFR